jgi:hypothetical protein
MKGKFSLRFTAYMNSLVTTSRCVAAGPFHVDMELKGIGVLCFLVFSTSLGHMNALLKILP